MRRTPIAILAGTAMLLTTSVGVASAHTEADVVAVPAGSEATITLKPSHGCGTSPTIEVAIQAPVAGAVAEDVDGWTASSEADGDKTVLEWTGGLLPADEVGEFPVRFTAPATPGELLLFPAIQYCEDGSTLEWLSGDPTSDYPAPRILVLPADHEAVSSIDDVAPDAPGRDKLAEIVDVDGIGAEEEPEAEEPEDGEAEGTATTEVVAEDEPDATDTDADVDADVAAADEDDDSSATPIIIGAVVVLAIAAGVALWARNRRPTPGGA